MTLLLENSNWRTSIAVAAPNCKTKGKKHVTTETGAGGGQNTNLSEECFDGLNHGRFDYIFGEARFTFEIHPEIPR